MLSQSPVTITRDGEVMVIPGAAWNTILGGLNWILAGDNWPMTELPDELRLEAAEWAAELQFQAARFGHLKQHPPQS